MKNIFKKYLLISLLLCGTVFSEEAGDLERHGFNPKAEFNFGSNFSNSFVGGNSLWTIKKDNIRKYVVNPTVFIETKTKKVKKTFLFVDISNVNFENIYKLKVGTTTETKTGDISKSFILYRTLGKHFFDISENQIKQIFDVSLDTHVIFSVIHKDKFYAACCGYDNMVVFNSFFNKINTVWR